MSRPNKVLSILLCVLIVISTCSLFIGIGNSMKIRQLQNAPPVIIDTAVQNTEVPSEDVGETSATLTESTINVTEKSTSEPTGEETEEISTKSSEEFEKTTKETESVSITSTTQEPTEEVVNNNSGFCYVTNSGTKYHKAGCSYLKKSQMKMTISEAKSSGYSPCSRCY